MRKYIGLGAAALTIAINVYGAPAAAQLARTFVSGKGIDTGTCGLGAPCRSFTFALTQTNAGGEIAVLDTAGYGTVNITKAVSITAPDGIEGAITVASAGVDAVDIAAGANDTVNLRGLVMTGSGIGNDGIHFTSGGRLNIQNCVIRNFNNEGIDILPGSSTNVTIIDTLVSGNADGVAVNPTGSGNYNVTLSRVSSVSNLSSGFLVTGFSASGGVLAVTAADSLASNNGSNILHFGVGFEVDSSAVAAVTTLMLTNSKTANNGFSGVAVSGTNAAVVLGQTTISGNPNGYVIHTGATASTFGNNQILDGSNTGTLTPIAVK